MVIEYCAQCRGLSLDYPAPEVLFTFEAKHPGRCGNCDYTFDVGDSISCTTDHTYIHEECP